ncbi:HNH endonuclease [Nocardia miyunensis]|uniref:HNH endonuclease n=1 Tax=Nocardia miyunensis TaxID=282684 RepID=UPI00350E4930
MLRDRQPVQSTVRRREIISRLLTGRCEICKRDGEVEVHHVVRLADLAKPGRPQPAWAQLMARMRRKTLVSAANVIATSIPDLLSRTRNHRRAACGESRMGGSGGGRCFAWGSG